MSCCLERTGAEEKAFSPRTASGRGKAWNLPALPQLHGAVLNAVVMDLEVSEQLRYQLLVVQTPPGCRNYSGGGGRAYPGTHKLRLKSSQEAKLSYNQITLENSLNSL